MIHDGFEQRSSSQAGNTDSSGLLVLLVLALVQFTSIVDFMVVMPLGPQMIRVLGLSTEQFSLIVASYSISAGLAGLLASSIMDRFGTEGRVSDSVRRVSCRNAGMRFDQDTTCTLLAARAFTGAFGGILGGLGLTIIADVFPEEQRGRATGVLMSAFALAPCVGVPTRLATGQAVWLACSISDPGGARIGDFHRWASRHAPAPRASSSRRARPSTGSNCSRRFGNHGTWIAFALTASVMFGAFSVIPYISLSLVANVGVPEEKLWLVFLTGGILTLVGAPLIGALADRFGKLLVFRIVSLIAACLHRGRDESPCGTAGGRRRDRRAADGEQRRAHDGFDVDDHRQCRESVARRADEHNSAVQHVSAGLGAYLGGLILVRENDGPLYNFSMVGLMAVVATLISLHIAGHLKRPGELRFPGRRESNFECQSRLSVQASSRSISALPSGGALPPMPSAAMMSAERMTETLRNHSP